MVLVARRVDVVAESEVQREIVAQLKVILNMSGVVIRAQPRIDQRVRQLLLLRLAEEETGKGIASVWVIRSKCGLIVIEAVVGGRIASSHERILVGSPFKSEIKGVTAPHPADIFGGDQAVGHVTVVALGAESCVGDADGAAIKADLRKDQTSGVGNAQLNGPIRAVDARCLAEVVEPIQADG